MAKQKENSRVVIVGAGPVGMVCALALNRRGIPVTVFEQEPAPVRDQRAASLHPTTLTLLQELGVTGKIIPLGLVSPKYRFHDRVTGAVVAEFDLDLMRDEFEFPFVLQYEQYKLTASIAAEYANAGDFDVRFSHCVTGLTQHEDRGGQRWGKCGKSGAFCAELFPSTWCEIRNVFPRISTGAHFPQRLAPGNFRIRLGWESLTRIVPATNQLHQPVRRLGMDFRAETTRFGPTSHTQMSSEFHTQDSTIGPAQD